MSHDELHDEPEVADLQALLGDFAHRAPMRALPARPTRRRTWIAGGIAAVVAAAVLVLLLRRTPHTEVASTCTGPTGFAFSISSGSARCGGASTTAGRLPVNTWLETPANGQGDVRIADIGELTIFGDSKLRIVGTSAREHRLELARGHVSARVTAPPRLFVIDTPAATAVDLGCAYDLVVAPDGQTHLAVTVGVVSLEGKSGADAYVIAGYEVTVAPGQPLGVPTRAGAAPELAAAVAANNLGTVITLATESDALTLWHLVARTTGPARAGLVDALLDMVSLPANVTRDAILAGDPAALTAWRDNIARFLLVTERPE